MSDSLTLPIITVGLSGAISIGGAVFNYYLTRRSKRLDAEQQRQEEAEKLVARYAKPLLLAAIELEGRLKNILAEELLGRAVLWPDWQPHPDWPITHDYYLKSTLYLIGQLFAWIDIMKKEEIFLPLSDKKINQDFQRLLDDCVEAFSDARVSPGVMIFRHQQRAIGEQMSETVEKDKTRRCISYSTFVEKYEDDERYRRWFEPAEALIVKIAQRGDPRMQRLQAVVVELKQFIHFAHTRMGIQIVEKEETVRALAHAGSHANN